MKADTMRTIDYWLGVPLCCLSTLLLMPLRRRPRPDVNRVLFIELSEMGSAILVDPAMRKLRERTGCELYFVIFKQNRRIKALANTRASK